ncbi:MAG TPA: methylmalonyl Co-A mutase-associated GTPase MeaB [Fimbriimonas sp.]
MDSSALSVQEGVSPKPSINPKALRAKAKPQPSPAEWVAMIRQGDTQALSRAITLVESSAPRHRALSQEVVDRCLPYSGDSVRIGVTGVPGVGKSTFIESFGIYLIENTGKRLAVLAIDPTSSISHGSILGDKSRMTRLSASPRAFVRPSPAGGSLGGVARKTREAMILCEAAGHEIVLVETVGVGQSELTVHSMVDCFLLLMLAGAGDEMQGIKRGIMEMADLLTITKVDGENVNAAKVARQRYLNALHLFPPTASGWTPPVLLSSAVTGAGIDSVWSEIVRFVEHEGAGGFFDARRSKQAKAWFQETIENRILERFHSQSGMRERLQFLEERVMRGEIGVRSAVDALFE